MRMAVRFLTLVLVLGVAVSAVAGSSASGKMQISRAATVNGTQLEPGEYKVKWEGEGDKVKVSIQKGKETIATTPAKLVKKDNGAGNSVLTVANGGSVNAVKEIRLDRGKTVLILPTQAEQAGN